MKIFCAQEENKTAAGAKSPAFWDRSWKTETGGREAFWYLSLFSGNPAHYLGGGAFQRDMVQAEQKEQVLSKKEPWMRS